VIALGYWRAGWPALILAGVLVSEMLGQVSQPGASQLDEKTASDEAGRSTNLEPENQKTYTAHD